MNWKFWEGDPSVSRPRRPYGQSPDDETSADFFARMARERGWCERHPGTRESLYWELAMLGKRQGAIAGSISHFASCSANAIDTFWMVSLAGYLDDSLSVSSQIRAKLGEIRELEGR